MTCIAVTIVNRYNAALDDVTDKSVLMRSF